MTDKEIQDRIIKYDLLFESRLSKVEKTCEHLDKTCDELKTDMRWLMTIFGGGFLALAGIMAHGFKWF